MGASAGAQVAAQAGTAAQAEDADAASAVEEAAGAAGGEGEGAWNGKVGGAHGAKVVPLAGAGSDDCSGLCAHRCAPSGWSKASIACSPRRAAAAACGGGARGVPTSCRSDSTLGSVSARTYGEGSSSGER